MCMYRFLYILIANIHYFYGASAILYFIMVMPIKLFEFEFEN